MNPVVVDASALAAIVFNEPDAERVAAQLDNATVLAPSLLPYELAEVAAKKVKRHPEARLAILRALADALDSRWGLELRDVSAGDAATVAADTGLTACDAAYLWLAGVEGADLITLDAALARAGREGSEADA